MGKGRTARLMQWHSVFVFTVQLHPELARDIHSLDGWTFATPSFVEEMAPEQRKELLHVALFLFN